MTQPIFHPKTKLQIDSYIRDKPHSLMLIGPAGSGKLHRAKWLAEQLQLHPIHVSVLEDKKLIGIEQIQQLYTQTRTGAATMVIIEDAELMSSDAQNALLKLLEEPPENTHFVLTVSDNNKILRTIKSRCQTITLTSPSKDQLKEHLDSLSSSGNVSLIATAQGRIGTITDVLSDGALADKHTAALDEAKRFYTGSAYERLSLLQAKGFERDWALGLLELTSVIIGALLNQPKQDTARITKLRKQVTEIEAATQALQQAGNPKIHLSKLALNL